jgi:hypothetical protein
LDLKLQTQLSQTRASELQVTEDEIVGENKSQAESFGYKTKVKYHARDAEVAL